MNYFKEKLKDLLNIASPSGDTKEAIDYLNMEFSKLSYSTKLTNKGALLINIPGKEKTNKLLLSAHVDTLGAMVKEIKNNGRLKFSKIGGYSNQTVEGANVKVKTFKGTIYTGTILTNKQSIHVHGDELSKIERKDDNMEIRIDEIINSKEDIENLGINVGDFVYIDPNTEFTNSGFIKSRHLDDKLGVIILLSLAKKLKDNNIVPKKEINILITNYEEVGHGGSSGIPKDTKEFIAVDMAAVGEGQTSNEFSVGICAKDSSGPYDLSLRRKLQSIAIKNNLNFNIDIYPFYSSDASVLVRAGHDIKTGLIGPGIDSSHSYERTHIDSVINTLNLLYYYIID